MERPTVGELWRGTIDVAHRHFASFAVIAAVLVLLPILVLRLMFPEVLAMSATTMAGGTPPVSLPTGYWPFVILGNLGYLFGLFCIAAVTADPDEGGGRTLAAIIGSALPAIGKAVLAALVFMLAYVAFLIVLGIALAIVGGILIALTGFKVAQNDPSTAAASVGLVALIPAIVVPLFVWVGARLSPLTGVYLREPVGVVAGIRRAWALSRGSAWVIVQIVLVVGVLTLLLLVPNFLAARAGLVIGIGGFVAGLVLGAMGALLFVYQAAGMGYLYRRLRAVEGQGVR